MLTHFCQKLASASSIGTKRREQLAKECRQMTTFIVNDNKNGNSSRGFLRRNGLKSA